MNVRYMSVVYGIKSEARCQSLRIALCVVCSTAKKRMKITVSEAYTRSSTMENVMAMEILNVPIQKAST